MRGERAGCAAQIVLVRRYHHCPPAAQASRACAQVSHDTELNSVQVLCTPHAPSCSGPAAATAFAGRILLRQPSAQRRQRRGAHHLNRVQLRGIRRGLDRRAWTPLATAAAEAAHKALLCLTTYPALNRICTQHLRARRHTTSGRAYQLVRF